MIVNNSNYKNKYIKYKIKYIDLQKLYGGMISTTPKIINDKQIQPCGDIITFTNKFSICWYLSILIIFIFGDKTSSHIQNTLYNNFNRDDLINKSEKLLKMLLKDNYNKNDLSYLILLIKYKFEIKYDKINNKKEERLFTRQNSFDKSNDIKLLYNSMFNYLPEQKGGRLYDSFFFSNILSSILLNKFIKYTIFNPNNLININLAKNSLGIIIRVTKHDCCFFKCNNKLMYSSNSLSIKYNWLKLFKKYNYLITHNIEFKVFLFFNNDIGPIIITKNNEIFNYKNKKTNEMLINLNLQYVDIEDSNIEDLNIEDSDNILILKFFTILTFNNKNNYEFIKDNIVYDLIYYIENDNDNNDNSTQIKKILDNYEYNYNLLFSGRSAFYTACGLNKSKIVKLFLESDNCIDYNLPYNGMSPFYTSCELNLIFIVELLLNTNKIIYYNLTYNGMTPFYTSCSNGNIDIVKLFLESDKEIDYNLTYNGMTPFFNVCLEQRIDIIDLLLKSNKNINYNLSYNNYTPLYLACLQSNTDIVKLFLESDKNIDYNKQSKGGITPFYELCTHNNIELVYLFLQSGKDIDYNLQFNEKTPFYEACNNNSIEIVKLLLDTDKEIDYNKPYNGKTPLNIAYEKNYFEIVELLLHTDKIINK